MIDEDKLKHSLAVQGRGANLEKYIIVTTFCNKKIAIFSMLIENFFIG